MAEYKELQILNFDHIEFAVANLEEAVRLYEKMGFSVRGHREILERGLHSILMGQNDTAILLSHSTREIDPVAQYVQKHGDGVCNIAFRCQDAFSAIEKLTLRGARVLEPPRTFQKDFGTVQQATIAAFGEVRHSFVSRQGDLFLEGFEAPLLPATRGLGLKRIDHITTNVEKGQLDTWSEFYERVFGLENTRFFDIHTEKTGLYSKVMQSPDRVIKMPVNEPGAGANQIQEFLDVNHGAGVQHIALETDSILSSVKLLSDAGVPFLEAPPATYYGAIRQRIGGLRENLESLQSLGILVDGTDKGYLLQIFTQNLVGPFFYEAIQRCGDDGFGEGNFKALFEAIEQNQIQRGVLK
jgi:4-hydroxyphenylpyruvate dioxygenase